MSSPSNQIAAESEARTYRILQELVADSDIHALELLLGKFNLFEALNLMRQEVRHSAFLAYLLCPQQNHGLGDVFIKALLQKALTGRIDGVTPIHIDVWNLTEAEVHCEWQNIDIFIRDETHHLAVIIENKIGSTEHDDQLRRYLSTVNREHAEWQIVPIYLTVEGDNPKDERYIAIGYNQVCQLLTSILDLRGKALDSDVRVLIEHYVEMLRRHFLSESQIAELCKKLYARHKAALDLIYEHRPDRVQHVREFLEHEISKNDQLILDHCSKSYIRFLPKKLDTAVLKKGSGWTLSGRMLLFEVENLDGWLVAKLIIGPGPSELREKLFELAQRKPFTGATKLYPQWTMIYKQRLLPESAYGLEDEAFDEKLAEAWKKFVEKELPTLIAAFDDVAWMHTESGLQPQGQAS